MSKTLEGMVAAYKRAIAKDHKEALEQGRNHNKPAAMGTALLYLADNVSDEMVRGYEKFLEADSGVNTRRDAISAALRAAAGSAPTPSEVK